MAPFLDTGQIGIKEESFPASCVLPVGPLVMSVRAPIRVERAGFFDPPRTVAALAALTISNERDLLVMG